MYTASAAPQELREQWGEDKERKSWDITEHNLVVILWKKGAGIKSSKSIIKEHSTFGHIMLIPHLYSSNLRLHKRGPRALFTPETQTAQMIQTPYTLYIEVWKLQ